MDLNAFTRTLDSFLVTSIGGPDNYQIDMVGETAGRLLEMSVISGDPSNAIQITAPGLTFVGIGLEPAWSYAFFVLHNGQYWKCFNPHQAATANEPGLGFDYSDFWRLVAEENGTHDGAAGDAILTDTTQAWIVDDFVGRTIQNTTDGSTAVVASNTATTITAHLTGTLDRWH